MMADTGGTLLTLHWRNTRPLIPPHVLHCHPASCEAHRDCQNYAHNGQAVSCRFGHNIFAIVSCLRHYSLVKHIGGEFSVES